MTNDELLLELRKLVQVSKLFMVLFDLQTFAKRFGLTDFEQKAYNTLKESVRNFYPDLKQLESQIQIFDEFIVTNGSQLLKEKDSEIAGLIFDYFLYKEKLIKLTETEETRIEKRPAEDETSH